MCGSKDSVCGAYLAFLSHIPILHFSGELTLSFPTYTSPTIKTVTPS
jgi:hypothetical protein